MDSWSSEARKDRAVVNRDKLDNDYENTIRQELCTTMQFTTIIFYK